MTSFADRTGLTSSQAPERYLWTDAFAVCNFLGLARRTGQDRYRDLALRLVDQVHHTLGKHRPDDPRTGWLSGLEETAGEQHPTAGGLRIGKELPERRIDQPFDDQLEWERDGQYFHYLTKWMHALDQVARATGEPRFNRWARELARVSCAAFAGTSLRGRGPGRMVWKMSIDLSRPLVPSMGQHDPLDGWITCLQLRASASELSVEQSEERGPDLAEETAGFATMARAGDWATADPLGIGGLWVEASRVRQLLAKQACPDRNLLPELLAAADMGLRYYRQQADLEGRASHRLAFRELGLAIGLATTGRAEEQSLADQITAFWLEPRHQQQHTWASHRNINEVMLATDLVPEGFISLGS
ncbi:MAG: hypothetical protein PVI24_10030 [Myxococcales bacterium]|jgi:hypothetical protein